jgi:hypothetical protein
MGEERLLPPPTPREMTLREFGQRVMRWGTGNAAARARISTLTREELERAELTREMAKLGVIFIATRWPETLGILVPQVERS